MTEAVSDIYFSAVFPWQTHIWKQLSSREQNLPHGLLFSGMQGIGKRAFVWHFTAWLLCVGRSAKADAACGHCQSCQWLISGTHPDCYVLPATSLPVSSLSGADDTKSTKKKTTKKSSQHIENEPTKTSIKVDDIRQLQPFINQGSLNRRICVIDNADTMTVAAANALLKTLEEPRAGVTLMLISDNPTNLLPTIKSRVQDVGIHQLLLNQAVQFLSETVSQEQLLNDSSTNESTINQQVIQALSLANGAPLAALDMLKSDWYAKRELWVKTWLALRSGKRSSTAASDYWQKTVSLESFIKMTELMLSDINRLSLGIAALQQDLNLQQYGAIALIKSDAVYQIMQTIDDIKQATNQNVQQKLGFDQLLSSLQWL